MSGELEELLAQAHVPLAHRLVGGGGEERAVHHHERAHRVRVAAQHAQPLARARVPLHDGVVPRSGEHVHAPTRAALLRRSRRAALRRALPAALVRTGGTGGRGRGRGRGVKRVRVLDEEAAVAQLVRVPAQHVHALAVGDVPHPRCPVERRGHEQPVVGRHVEAHAAGRVACQRAHGRGDLDRAHEHAADHLATRLDRFAVGEHFDGALGRAAEHVIGRRQHRVVCARPKHSDAVAGERVPAPHAIGGGEEAGRAEA
mmetsp:Transcript_7960/g.20427  ORF Transcript_7960/g.20427 Transcript_7960/m.20427 type:complete len:258 (+) Transcript_7960:1336-2109(+)